MIKRLFFLIILGCAILSCSKVTSGIEDGLSKNLADCRYSSLDSVVYSPSFSLPNDRSEAVKGSITIDFVFKDRSVKDIVIDFKSLPSKVKEVKLNGKSVDYIFENEHIIIDKSDVKKAKNSVYISFEVDDTPLNRRDDLVYTLLVPDRARGLMPCFDQPDIKALYNLTVQAPNDWVVIANGPVKDSCKVDREYNQWTFETSDPLPTYLFAFVAGDFSRVEKERGGKVVSLYHKEMDSSKIAQCGEILEEVFHSLEWLEDYTGVAYPFKKYDLIILPSFEFGGMEHAGATLYNDRRMFLESDATIQNRISRSELIAHETAHMWFGDYVTMKWFDDVWTKEVFANYFASQIVTPMYNNGNHDLQFIDAYYPAAYKEDRTKGANPIKQSLSNLKYAGLVYGNIIYDKAPIVMNMLVKIMGEDNFRNGIREYLKQYAYSNATWDGLVEIMDNYSKEDLKLWSREWIYTGGMPRIDIKGAGVVVVGGQEIESICVDNRWKPTVETEFLIPNSGGMGYGYFTLSDSIKGLFYNSSAELANSIELKDETKLSLLNSLYEELIRGRANPQKMAFGLLKYIESEDAFLLYNRALKYLSTNIDLFFGDQESEIAERLLWKMLYTTHDKSKRIALFGTISTLFNTKYSWEKIYKIWEAPDKFDLYKLGGNEIKRVSLELIARDSSFYKKISLKQFSRIDDSVAAKEYLRVAEALSPDYKVRDSIFESLLNYQNRAVEPVTADVLRWLNSKYRAENSVKYLERALQEVEDIQKTGDIFFPTKWLNSLLWGHRSREAYDILNNFISNSSIEPMLLNKIYHNSYHLCLLYEE